MSSVSNADSSNGVLQRALLAFEREFGRPARIAAAAPGRINLMGDHVDYCGGLVLPMAIDRSTFVVGDFSSASQIRLYSAHHRQTGVLVDGSRSAAVAASGWAEYPRGMVAGFESAGIPVPGFDAVIDSEVPLGAGLSSSAALEMATATFLEALTGHRLDPWEKARMGQTAEHVFAGVPCGLMDQMAAVFGREGCVLLFDCDHVSVEAREFPAERVAVLALDTGVRHELGASEYPRRREDCERAARFLGMVNLRQASLETLAGPGARMDPTTRRRAVHVVTENERTRKMVSALERCDWGQCRLLMKESHASLRDDFEVSCPELDAVVQIADEIGISGGVYGCRMTGGGFGGSCVALVDPGQLDALPLEFQTRYERRTGLKLNVLVTRPGRGAHRIG
jgi:galactokinase